MQCVTILSNTSNYFHLNLELKKRSFSWNCPFTKPTRHSKENRCHCRGSTYQTLSVMYDISDLLCAQEELMDSARQAGADVVGGKELIQQVTV